MGTADSPRTQRAAGAPHWSGIHTPGPAAVQRHKRLIADRLAAAAAPARAGGAAGSGSERRRTCAAPP
eukprot:231621-Prymnesium_polylepis.1